MHAPTLSLVPPPAPKAPTPPPPQHIRAALATTSAPETPSAPAAHTSLIRTLLPTQPAADNPPIALATGPMMPSASSSPLAIGSSSGPAVTVAPAAPAPHVGPLHISAGVTAGLLLAPIVPQYPAIARAAGIQGTVIIHALISRTGTIEQAQVLSGSPMLQNAALEAVQRARYKPYLLNGQPTEVDTTITVNFRMGS